MTPQKETMQKVLQKIQQYDKIVISRHKRPDGDAIGSTKGLCGMLKLSFPQKDIRLVNGDSSNYLAFLGGEDKPVDTDFYKDALLIVIDTATEDRISNPNYKLAKEIVKIDHHIDIKPYGDLCWIESWRSSSCEMIAFFYDTFKDVLKMDKDTSLMTATGSAICGAAAVLGAEPVVKCESHKTAIAVSTVVIFGTISMFLYPIMYRIGMLDGLSNMEVAIYTGSTLHEVAHVAGAGNAMDPTDTLGIAGTATITKMIRVMMLAPVLVVMGLALSSRGGKYGSKGKITVPWFAFGFIGVICVNSLLQYLFAVDSVKDIPLNGAIEYIDTFMLTMAMTALGTDTSIDKFKKAGAKPFVLALMLYVWLVVGGYLLVKYFVPALL